MADPHRNARRAAEHDRRSARPVHQHPAQVQNGRRYGRHAPHAHEQMYKYELSPHRIADRRPEKRQQSVFPPGYAPEEDQRATEHTHQPRKKHERKTVGTGPQENPYIHRSEKAVAESVMHTRSPRTTATRGFAGARHPRTGPLVRG